VIGNSGSRPATRRAASIEAARDELLELHDQVVGLVAAAGEQVGHQVGGVAARDAAALDRLVDDLLQARAREHDDVQRVDHSAKLVADAALC